MSQLHFADTLKVYILSAYEHSWAIVFFFFRWSGFLLCAFAMLLVIFPMFTFPKKLPPRHKKKNGADNASNDDDVLKEKTNSQTVASSMGFGKDIKGLSVMNGYPKVMC